MRSIKEEPPRMNMKRAAWMIFGISLLIGVLTRFMVLLHYVNFEGDQVRDAYVFAGMRHGIWPVLGPEISGSYYQLPPLYYYLVFPITLVGMHPALQALPNALFSVLTIPLITFTLYRLLEGVSDSRRFFLSAVGGLWWSASATDINYATRDWNPSSIPFFITAFILIASIQVERPRLTNIALGSWSALGALTAILISLHASTLYVMPVVFIAVWIAFVIRSPACLRLRAGALVFWSGCVAIACLAPYWRGQINERWRNASEIFSYAHAASGKMMVMDKIENVMRAYGWLNGQGYFLGDSRLLHRVGLLFLIAIVPIALVTFRGNRVLFAMLCGTWVTYLCAASSYPPFEIYWRLPIAVAPLFLSVSSLAFINYASIWGRIMGSGLALSLFISITSNVLMDVKHSGYVIGPSRLLAVSDVINALNRIPYGASVCAANEADGYIDEYMTKRQLNFSGTCTVGSYAILPKFVGEGVTGSDFSADWRDHGFSYLKSADRVPALALPEGFHTMASNDAFRLIVIDQLVSRRAVPVADEFADILAEFHVRRPKELTRFGASCLGLGTTFNPMAGAKALYLAFGVDCR